MGALLGQSPGRLGAVLEHLGTVLKALGAVCEHLWALRTVLGGLVNRLRRTMGRRKDSWVLLGGPGELSSGAWGVPGVTEEVGSAER